MYVEFEVSTAVGMKSIIFWDMTPCSPLNANRRFGGTIASIFRVEEISSAVTSNHGFCLSPACFVAFSELIS
jgi:hypothetical protein